MKKQLIWLFLAGLLTVAALAQAEEVKTTVDLSYVTKYIWRGFDKLDDKAAFQPSVNFALENGLFFNVWSSFAGSSKGNGSISTVNATEMDYTIGYANTFGEDCYVTNYKVGWRFYDYPDMPSNDADMQEGFIEMAWPNLIGYGITPHYAYYHMWASEGSGAVRGAGGPIHAMGFNYDWSFESAPELPMTFSWDIVYNDGTGVSTDDHGNVNLADHDWSHMVWGLTTRITCPVTGGTIKPGIWFQKSMEDTVNTQDELWSGISYSLTF